VNDRTGWQGMRVFATALEKINRFNGAHPWSHRISTTDECCDGYLTAYREPSTLAAARATWSARCQRELTSLEGIDTDPAVIDIARL
jgi:hypothetical protein